MSSSAEFSVREVIVAPGGEEVVGLTIRNVGPSPEVFALVATGLAQSWMQIEPATVALPPGSFETVKVALRPPRSWAVGAGPTPFGVRVVPHGGIEEVTIADGLVNVLSFDERRLLLAQPVQRSRRRAEFDLVLENTGNSQASCRLALLDPTRRVKGKFQPPSVGVDPGMNEPTRLTVIARRRRWRRERSLPFFVQAIQDGHPTVEASGTLLQETIISGRTIGRLALCLAAAGAIVGAWFGVAKPQIDKAAERAVAKLGTTPAVSVDPSITTIAGTNPADGALVPTATTVLGAPVGPTTGSQPFDDRIEVSAPIREQRSGSITVKAGQRWLITDALFQNPNGDQGDISLLRNTDVLYKGSLDNFSDFLWSQYSGIGFQPGDTMTLQLTCRGTRAADALGCEIAVTVTGTSHPA